MEIIFVVRTQQGSWAKNKDLAKAMVKAGAWVYPGKEVKALVSIVQTDDNESVFVDVNGTLRAGPGSKILTGQKAFQTANLLVMDNDREKAEAALQILTSIINPSFSGVMDEIEDLIDGM
jgi:hypothetical protein